MAKPKLSPELQRQLDLKKQIFQELYNKSHGLCTVTGKICEGEWISTPETICRWLYASVKGEAHPVHTACIRAGGPLSPGEPCFEAGNILKEPATERVEINQVYKPVVATQHLPIEGKGWINPVIQPIETVLKPKVFSVPCDPVVIPHNRWQCSYGVENCNSGIIFEGWGVGGKPLAIGERFWELPEDLKYILQLNKERIQGDREALAGKYGKFLAEHFHLGETPRAKTEVHQILMDFAEINRGIKRDVEETETARMHSMGEMPVKGFGMQLKRGQGSAVDLEITNADRVPYKQLDNYTMSPLQDAQGRHHYLVDVTVYKFGKVPLKDASGTVVKFGFPKIQVDVTEAFFKGPTGEGLSKTARSKAVMDGTIPVQFKRVINKIIAQEVERRGTNI